MVKRFEKFDQTILKTSKKITLINKNLVKMTLLVDVTWQFKPRP
jgi:hypothetical protein